MIVANCNEIVSWAVQGLEKWAVIVLKSAAVASGRYDAAVAKASPAPYATIMTPKMGHRRRA